MREHARRAKLDVPWCGILTLICGISVRPLIGEQPFMLSPLRTVDVKRAVRALVPDLTPVIFHGFKASGDRLYFLVSGGPTTDNSWLVTTDLSGAAMRATSLGPDPVMDFTPAESEHVRVLRLPPRGPAVEAEIDASGKVSGTWHELPMRSPSALVGSSVIGGQGEIADVSSGRITAYFGNYSDPLGSYRTFMLDSHHAARIDINEAGIEIVDLTTGASTNVHITGDAIEAARKAYSDMPGNGVTVLAASSDGRGRLYVLLSGFNINSGPTVVVVTASGQVLNELQCFLPGSGGGGAALPMAVGVAQHHLFILSEAGSLFTFDLNTSGVSQ